MNAAEVLRPEDTSAPLLKLFKNVERFSQFFVWRRHWAFWFSRVITSILCCINTEHIMTYCHKRIMPCKHTHIMLL